MVLDNHVDSRDFTKRGKPRWLRMQLPQSEHYHELRQLVAKNNLHTVCQEARCPNMGECWSHGVATLMILGDTCTRSCGFCNIKTGKPPVLDIDEPRRVGEAVAIMNLRFVCITSVNRDELPDGGAKIWAETIREIRTQAPNTQIEALIPDFCGDWSALQTVLDAKPDVLNHNLETVARMYRVVRPQAKYERSMELLRRAKEQGFVAKTSIMAGIGETDAEIEQLMHDLLKMTATDHGACDILTIGQYLQPSANHLPVQRFVHPDTFAAYKTLGESLGITHVESGPMVRSSYHADQQAKLASEAMDARG
ncbi:MAG: lipoyl synthase [Phycisphaera sp.]|nr:lipoyl synthase [Phycisphaera sp.]